MYTLYNDKESIFEADIDLYGASFRDTKCRLVIESSIQNLIFYGTVATNGKVNIPINKIKRILPEGTNGNIKLEVIAEDTYFIPWEEKFEVRQRIGISEVKNPQLTMITETSVKMKNTNTHTDKLISELGKYKVTQTTLTTEEGITKFKKILTKFIKENKVTDHNFDMDYIVSNLDQY